MAELEVLFGAEKITKLSDVAALVDDKSPDVDKLGGSIKIISNVHKLGSTNWAQASNEITKYLKNHARSHAEGKITIGLSVYNDKSVTPKNIQKYLITTKKDMRSAGFSVRVIPNKTVELNSAQVLHNRLTAEKNAEIVLVRSRDCYWIGRTAGVQNIEALSKRDQGRPKRDARVGMLPPKLALIMVNLGVPDAVVGTGGRRSKTDSELDEYEKEVSNGPRRTQAYAEGSNVTSDEVIASRVSGVDGSAGRQADSLRTVLDPFCGTGVVLQEALLLGLNTYGTDIEPRMIAYSQENLDWLEENFNQFASSSLSQSQRRELQLVPVAASGAPACPSRSVGSSKLEVGDAQYHKWAKPFDAVVCETYLGSPMSSSPAPDKLADIRSEVNSLVKTFLKNIHRQLSEGATLCLAVPAWRVDDKFIHLNLLDDLEDLGYTRLVLKHTTNSELIYFRPDQTVAREILILKKETNV